MEELAKIITKKFIQRRDVKAEQNQEGEYSPCRDNSLQHLPWKERPFLPWRGRDVLAHLSGSHTYGHYLIDPDDNCKLFAFDIDLEQYGLIPRDCPEDTGPTAFDPGGPADKGFQVPGPREVWRNRRHPGRAWFKFQFRMMAELIANAAYKELELPVAVAYSGYKGVHVYCFTGAIKARDARQGALLVLEGLDQFELFRGTNFWRHKDQSENGYPNLSIEVYPKQESIEGKDLGNLMRLPLGKNKRAPDPTFFLDLSAPLFTLEKCDPVWALTTNNPWAGME